jgi:pimeloyl-ACP methyl ester carboxylesterase
MLSGRPQPTFATLASGVRLHYRVQGNPAGPWIVLLNGLLSDTTMWAGVLPLLTADHRVLTFDSRGQGKSDAPLEGPYPTALLADEAWELMQVLGVQRPVLVGLSNGSAMSLELLTAHPGAFTGAVLVSSVPHIDFAMRLKAEHWAHCLEVGGPLLQFDAVAPFLWGDRFLEARHGVLRAYHQVVTGSGQNLHGPLHQIRGIFGWDLRGNLDKVRAPILVLSGAEDLLTPPWKCLETARLIHGSRFEMVSGIGHSYPVEDPKGFAARLRRALLEWKVGLAE